MSLRQRERMTIDQEPDVPVWGASPPNPQRWGARETVMAVGVAGVIAALGGAAIYAATDSHSQPFGHGPPGAPAPGGFSAAHVSSAFPALHGELVTGDGKGGFITMLTQSGTVTAITPDTVTVRSADAFTQTYELPPGAQKTGQPIVVNEEVSIQGKRNGQVATATSVNTQTGPDGPSGPPGPAGQN
jgi:hypothetical protein